EISRRELVLDRAYSSLFDYCVRKLGYSRQAAFFRIRAAEAIHRFPDILQRLRAGHLKIDAIARLHPHLNAANKASLLAEAEGASDAAVRFMVAALGATPAPERDVIVPVSPPQFPPQEALPPRDSGDAEAARSSCGTPAIIPPPQHRFHFTGDSDLFA